MAQLTPMDALDLVFDSITDRKMIAGTVMARAVDSDQTSFLKLEEYVIRNGYYRRINAGFIVYRPI